MLPQTLTGKIAYNTLVQILGKGITTSFTILVTILLTRALGKEGYGNYSLIVTFPAVLYLLADFGLNAIAVREYQGRDEKIVQIFPHLLTLRVLFSFLFVFLVLLILPFLPYSSLVKIGILGALLTVFSQSLFTSANSIFQTKLRYDLSVFSILGGVFLGTVLILWGVWKNFSLLYFVFSHTFAALTFPFLAFYLLSRFGVSFSFGKNREILRKLLWASFPVGLMLLFSQINGKADVFLLSFLSLPSQFGLTNSETLGIYSLSYTVFANLLVFPTFFMNALYPILIADHQKSSLQFLAHLKKALIFLLGTSVFFTVLALSFAPLIVLLLGGRGFSESILPLRILSLGLPLFFLTSPLQWALLTVGREKVLPAVYFAAAVFNVGANLIFIPRYSYLATSWITVASEGLVLTLLALVALRYLGANRSR